MLEQSFNVQNRLGTYLKTQYGCDVLITGDSSAAVNIQFITAPTKGTEAQAISDAQTGTGWGGWTAQGMPDLQSFQTAIFSDSTLTASAKTQLLNLIPTLQMNISNASLIQQFWSDLKSESVSWLDAKTVTLVEGYAAKFNIPLVTSSQAASSTSDLNDNSAVVPSSTTKTRKPNS